MNAMSLKLWVTPFFERKIMSYSWLVLFLPSWDCQQMKSNWVREWVWDQNVKIYEILAGLKTISRLNLTFFWRSQLDLKKNLSSVTRKFELVTFVLENKKKRYDQLTLFIWLKNEESTFWIRFDFVCLRSQLDKEIFIKSKL